MKKSFYGIFMCLFMLLLTACSGYNNTMYSHLSELENYGAYKVKLIDIYYIDAETKEKNSDYTDEDFANHDITFKVAFESDEDVAAFLGGTPNKDMEYTFNLEVIQDNNEILVSNGFYEEISLNEIIEIRATDFIYMDTNFFYIADVEYNETKYLDVDEGLANIVVMMENDKSLL